MALKPCPSCSKQVSINAISCPNCGEPNLDRRASSRREVDADITFIVKNTSNGEYGGRIETEEGDVFDINPLEGKMVGYFMVYRDKPGPHFRATLDEYNDLVALEKLY